LRDVAETVEKGRRAAGQLNEKGELVVDTAMDLGTNVSSVLHPRVLGVAHARLTGRVFPCAPVYAIVTYDTQNDGSD